MNPVHVTVLCLLGFAASANATDWGKLGSGFGDAFLEGQEIARRRAAQETENERIRVETERIRLDSAAREAERRSARGARAAAPQATGVLVANLRSLRGFELGTSCAQALANVESLRSQGMHVVSSRGADPCDRATPTSAVLSPSLVLMVPGKIKDWVTAHLDSRGVVVSVDAQTFWFYGSGQEPPTVDSALARLIGRFGTPSARGTWTTSDAGGVGLGFFGDAPASESAEVGLVWLAGPDASAGESGKPVTGEADLRSRYSRSDRLKAIAMITYTTVQSKPSSIGLTVEIVDSPAVAVPEKAVVKL